MTTDGVIHAVNGVGVSATPQNVTLHLSGARQRMTSSTARCIAKMLIAAADLAETPFEPDVTKR